MSFFLTVREYFSHLLVLSFQRHVRRTCSAKSESRRMTDSFSTTKASIISTPSSSTSFLALSIPTLEICSDDQDGEIANLNVEPLCLPLLQLAEPELVELLQDPKELCPESSQCL